MRGSTRRRVLKGVSTGSIVLGATHVTGVTGAEDVDRTAATANRLDDQAGDLEVSIVETNAPVGAGEYLDVTAEIRNAGSSDVQTDVDLYIGENDDWHARIGTTIAAGETETVSQGFYTYPVPEDAEFSVTVVVDGDSDEQTVSVTGADWLSNASPGGEFAVAPGTDVLFEAGPENPDDDHDIVWWVDGEQVSAFAGPWEYAYLDEFGTYNLRYPFEEPGTHDVAAAVVPRNGTGTGTYTAHWRVEVTSTGIAAPTVETIRPEPGTVPMTTGEDVTFELEARDPETELDRVVWWLTQADVILDVTELSGTSATAQLVTDATCHTCHVVPWVICSDGTVVEPDGEWQLERVEDGGNGNGSGADLDLSIRQTNSPVDAGEYLEVIVDIENTGDEVGEGVLELVVGHDPEVLDTQEIIVHPGETGAATLGFETYPTRQDEQFPVSVVGADDAVETTVQVFAR